SYRARSAELGSIQVLPRKSTAVWRIRSPRDAHEKEVIALAVRSSTSGLNLFRHRDTSRRYATRLTIHGLIATGVNCPRDAIRSKSLLQAP
ncbi:MAG TPA: hypothetical protein VFI90_14565, partial [Rubrobacter sp.]|nr:hypothetical protein [Rubrobacter sp.]